MGVDSVEAEVGALLDRGEVGRAATTVLRSYGPEVLGYLVSIVRDDDDAADVFSAFSEGMWKGLGGFRQDSTVRVWAYRIAWNAAMRFFRSPYRMRGRRLRTSEASRIAAEVQSTNSDQLRAQRKDRVGKLREKLDPEGQTLLTLRLDRGLSWKEVAVVMSSDDQPIDSTTVRKRFERVKAKLRALARDEGLLAR